MSMQLPVVTTTVVADGLRLPEASNVPLTVADDAASFAKSIVDALNNQEALDKKATESRDFVDKHFTWPKNFDRMEALCQRAVASAEGNN